MTNIHRYQVTWRFEHANEINISGHFDENIWAADEDSAVNILFTRLIPGKFNDSSTQSKEITVTNIAKQSK